MIPHLVRQPAWPLVTVIAEHLASPDAVLGAPHGKAWWAQSLAHGVPGIALLHIELAAAELGPWARAHAWLAAATRVPVTSGPDSHPFYGAPALAHALACAAGQLPDSYRRALAALDQTIIIDVRRRLAAAHRRIDHRRLPALAEFDTLRGLAGYGAYLLRRDPGGQALRSVLEYLVRLTLPVIVGGERLPGWWTVSDPSGRQDDRFPGGHANTGLAHGIAGPLALLALAARHGVTVDGHAEAIATICAWLDEWRVDTYRGPSWPYWVTRCELRSGRVGLSRPARPSWCYGTAGVARAQQVAALATGDTDRQRRAEDALARALADPVQLAATTDVSLCHGFAGLAHVAARASVDAAPETAARLQAAIPNLLDAVHPPGSDPRIIATAVLGTAEHGPGLLDGAAGVALSVLSADDTAPPRSGWDRCLLIA